MDKFTTSLAQLQLRAAQLADKRALAVAALEAATAARQSHRLEGDLADDKLDAKLQANVDLCVSRLTGLDADIAALQAKIADTEQKIATETASVRRKEASEKLARDLDAVEKTLAPYLEAGRRFTKALDALHYHFEATQLAAFVNSGVSQVEIAAAFTLQELRTTVRTIATGEAPIPAPKRETPPVATEQPPATRTVFATHSLKWTENGRLRTAPAFDDVALPPQLADKALRIGACVPLSHDMRKTHRGARGAHDPDPNAIGVVDLDAVSDYAPTRHSSFDPVAAANITPFDRGVPERQLKTAGPRL